jgi:hypothetical protein
MRRGPGRLTVHGIDSEKLKSGIRGKCGRRLTVHGVDSEKFKSGISGEPSPLTVHGIDSEKFKSGICDGGRAGSRFMGLIPRSSKAA